MLIGVVKENAPGERRVALVPGVAPSLTKAGLQLAMEAGAGADAGFPDAAYVEKGVRVAASRAEVFQTADVLLQVRTPGANPAGGEADLALMRRGQVVIGFADPLVNHAMAAALAKQGVTTLAMELMPRITRAQSMDALSSMATIGGYKAVLLAAVTSPRMFPMLMTAAGTITPARVLIIGVGVAGLQAIATARRMGAVVEAYDVRPAVKDQVQSLGAKFIELALETKDAEDKGGYAKGQDEAFYRRQQELMAKVVGSNDIVITTAVVPGRKAPILVTAAMVRGMAAGSVVVDLAAERGGNCELTRADETVVDHGVTILGPTNLPSTVPFHASQMYAKNVATFLLHLAKDGKLRLDGDDEIARDTTVTRDGQVVHGRVREALGLPGLAAVASER
jgi:NAD(P) transhydrogenase subunit alpha